jgi:hypothetical protein
METPDYLELKQLLEQESRQNKGMHQAISHRLEDLVALSHLPKFKNSHYLPWTRSALRPSTVMLLLNEIELYDRKVIVEFGSGISTLYISQLIAGTDRKLFTIDNNAEWQSIVIGQAQQLGVDLSNTQFIDAPLTPYSDGTYSGDWYDTDAIYQALPEQGIELILVDGPMAKAATNPRSRFPALPALHSRLAKDYSIFLDDCNRTGEQTIAKAWSETYDLDGMFLPERGNICLLHPKEKRRFNVT